MYKITVLFNSNIDGVYTKEEETATDLFQMQCKRNRMMNRWFGILCPHIDIDKYCSMANYHKYDFDTKMEKKMK